MNRIFTLLLLLSISSCGLLRDTTLKQDPKSDDLIRQGKRFLQSRQYTSALDAFQSAVDRDFNRSTTAAKYLAGLSAYFLEYEDIATSHFESIVFDYPRSKYVEDARYHLALIKVRQKSMREREQGLQDLIKIADTASDRLIREAAKEKWQKELFESAEFALLASLYAKVSPSHKTDVMEAWLYREVMEGNRESAFRRYQSFLTNKGEDTAFLQKMFGEDPNKENKPVAFEPDILKIGMFLPLFLNESQWRYSSEIPPKVVRGMEFYEGFQLAVDEFAQRNPEKVFLQVFDTRRDTFHTRMQLRQLDSLGLNLLVGAIYNNQSRILTDWAENRQVPQIVPLSPARELIENRNFVFLAHPTPKTHGAEMAEFAWYQRGVRRAVVFSDGTVSTEQLAEGFTEEFIDLGGQVDTFKFTYGRRLDKDIVKEINTLVGQVEDSTGVYIPIMGNEEAASLIVNLLKKFDRKVVLMGSPHFRTRYNTLPREVKEDFEMLFSTSHMHDPTSPAYRMMYNQYLSAYGFPPSDNAIQGYDLAKFLLTQLKSY
ncbi:MAG: ABC transporter substrate-binding protein, partial [Bacteroidota bacterium]